MRHSDPKLTANVYTDPRLLDVHSALDALPMLPLNSSPIQNTQTMRITGTDAKPSSLVVPLVASNADFRGHSLTSTVLDDSGINHPQPLGDDEMRAYIPAPHENPAWWCNGSTSDSESLSRGSNPRRAIEERSLSVNDSERFSLADMALAESVLAESISCGNAARVTAVYCEFLETSVATATGTATVEGSRFSALKLSVLLRIIAVNSKQLADESDRALVEVLLKVCKRVFDSFRLT